MASHERNTSEQHPRAGVNRRTLMRTGAHAAWSIPAVQLVTQAPAYAASGPAALSVTATNSGWTGNSTVNARFTVTTTVTNTNAQPTTNLSVTYTLPTGVNATVTPPAGWSVVEATNGTNVIVLEKIDPQLGGDGTTGPFIVTFDPADAVVGNEVPISITADPGGSGAPGTAATTVAVSPPVLTISSGTWAPQGSPPNNMNLTSLTVTNTGFQTTTALQVVVTLSGTLPVIENPLTAVTAAPGWTPTRTSNRVVTFTSNSQIGRNETVTFDPTVRTQGNVNSANGTVSLEVVASNPGTTPGTGSATKA